MFIKWLGNPLWEAGGTPRHVVRSGEAEPVSSHHDWYGACGRRCYGGVFSRLRGFRGVVLRSVRVLCADDTRIALAGRAESCGALQRVCRGRDALPVIARLDREGTASSGGNASPFRTGA